MNARILTLALMCCGCPLAAAQALGQSAPGPEQPAPDRQPDLDTAAPAPPPASWFETRLAIEERLDAGDYEGAAALGDRLLELAEAEFGPKSKRLAEAHALLGRVHREGGDYEAAEQDILDAIGVYESADGPLAASLIGPYLELGDNYEEAGDYSDAISAYGEARNIGRRNFGLLNEDQLPIIDEMTDAADKLGDVDQAEQLQLDALTLVERIYGTDSKEAIDAEYKYAAWLRAHRNYDEERLAYYRIEKVVEQNFDNDPLMRVRALREIAASYRDENNGADTGFYALRDAIDLLEKLPEPDPLLLAEVWTDMGDWIVEFNHSRTRIGSADAYVSAWNALGAVENGDQLRREWFNDLIVVEMPEVSRRGLTNDPGAPAGYVIVYFTVDTSGQPHDIEVTDSEPPGFKDIAFSRRVRDARYRPRIVDGALTAARHAQRFDFHYDPDAVEDTKEKDK